MAVHCSHCREELMGAVNRCWRCGQPINADSFDGELPPLRRAPLTIVTPEMNESLPELVQYQTEPPALQSRSLSIGATVLLGSLVSGIGLGGKPGRPACMKVM